MNCQNCNHAIKRVLTWNDQILGIECWKKIALPEIERIRQEKFDAYKKFEYQKNFALIQALKFKDLSKIKSDFKLKFIASIIEQFENKGFITKNQSNIVYGVDSMYGSWLNNTDKLNEYIALYLIGDNETKNWILNSIDSFYDTPKYKKYFEEGIGQTIQDYRII